MVKRGFDSEEYLRQQTEAILKRMEQFDNKLYIEFGGKLMFDYHAARILPGFDPNVKIRLLERFREKLEVLICLYAGDIERKKVRADFGITYDVDVLKIIDDLTDRGIAIGAVVITRFDNQPAAVMFKNKLERRGMKVYLHGATKGYPTDVDVIVSPEGYGANPYIQTDCPIVVVTAPGPCSGKLATCLSQLYHEHQRGIRAGYAKFETFPVWNMPLKHPVNVAYEAATADIGDVNLIDHFHLEAYDEKTVNYNRDLEAFPLLRRILEKITGESSLYRSPTDMGVNRVFFGIVDDEVVRDASIQEVIRRYFRYSCDYLSGSVEEEAVQRVALLMEELGVRPEDRRVVLPARQTAIDAKKKGKGADGVCSGAALELADGRIVTGKNSPLFHAASSLVLNGIKVLAGIPDAIDLLSVNVIESLGHLKKDVLGERMLGLDLEETMAALSICATTNPVAAEAVEKLRELRNCEVHLSHIPSPGDETAFRKLGVNLTSDPGFASRSLFEA
ncbi:MAG: hypothetical protein CSA35_05385 [Dethiosulfovibrio peptidovorans]|nr:MAG: hypothetical protein CSA35_05385 [Dethiosulfovibrio peptidovorans]